MTFVLTGTLPTLTRAQAEELIRQNGGTRPIEETEPPLMPPREKTYIKNTEITFDVKGLAESISSRFNNTYSVNNLLKRPVDDLGSMLTTELNAYRESLKA